MHMNAISPWLSLDRNHWKTMISFTTPRGNQSLSTCWFCPPWKFRVRTAQLDEFPGSLETIGERRTRTDLSFDHRSTVQESALHRWQRNGNETLDARLGQWAQVWEGVKIHQPSSALTTGAGLRLLERKRDEDPWILSEADAWTAIERYRISLN